MRRKVGFDTVVVAALGGTDRAAVSTPLGRTLGTLGIRDATAVGVPLADAVSIAVGSKIALELTLGATLGGAVGTHNAPSHGLDVGLSVGVAVSSTAGLTLTLGATLGIDNGIIVG